MNGQKSPGAVAALGASKIDQLGGKVDPENSLRSLIAQPLRFRAGIPKKFNHAGTIAAGSRASYLAAISLAT